MLKRFLSSMALFWNEALYVTWPLEKGLFVPDQTVKMQDQEGKEGGDSLWCWPPPAGRRGGRGLGGHLSMCSVDLPLPSWTCQCGRWTNDLSLPSGSNVRCNTSNFNHKRLLSPIEQRARYDSFSIACHVCSSLAFPDLGKGVERAAKRRIPLAVLREHGDLFWFTGPGDPSRGRISVCAGQSQGMGLSIFSTWCPGWS